MLSVVVYHYILTSLLYIHELRCIPPTLKKEESKHIFVFVLCLSTETRPGVEMSM